MNFFFSSRRRHTFFFQAEDGIRDRSPSRGLGDVYKRQPQESHGTAEKFHSAKRSARKMSDTDDSDGFEQMDIDPIKTDRGISNNQDTDDEELSLIHI